MTYRYQLRLLIWKRCHLDVASLNKIFNSARFAADVGNTYIIERSQCVSFSFSPYALINLNIYQYNINIIYKSRIDVKVKKYLCLKMILWYIIQYNTCICQIKLQKNVKKNIKLQKKCEI